MLRRLETGECALTQALDIAAADPGGPAAATAAHGYRREIDGLRAVAVIPVMLFHAGFAAFAGGWLGVDVFFVISGYLITGILLRDLAAGRFSLARFYERRARRILPALTFVLLASVPFAVAWMSPLALRGFADGFLATVLSVSNIYFWTVLDYFGPAAERLPLLHTWSLGIEEQFYFLFPLALAGLWRWRPGRLLAPILAIAAASLALAVWAAATHPSAGFFLLPFRAWELALGAALALTPGRPRGAPPRSPASSSSPPRWPPRRTSPTCCPSSSPPPAPPLSSATPAPATTATHLLGHPVPVGIGLVSYSAYLWHQPILAFARIRFGDILPPALLLALCALALLLAWPTWAWVERPFRRRATGSPRRPLTIAAATLSPWPRSARSASGPTASPRANPPPSAKSSPRSPTPTRTAPPARPTSTSPTRRIRSLPASSTAACRPSPHRR